MYAEQKTRSVLLGHTVVSCVPTELRCGGEGEGGEAFCDLYWIERGLSLSL